MHPIYIETNLQKMQKLVFFFFSFRIKNANDDASLIGLSDYEKKFIRQKSKCIFIRMRLFNAHMPVFFEMLVGSKFMKVFKHKYTNPNFNPDPTARPITKFYLEELKPFSRCFWSTTILSEKKHIDILRFIWYENRL